MTPGSEASQGSCPAVPVAVLLLCWCKAGRNAARLLGKQLEPVLHCHLCRGSPLLFQTGKTSVRREAFMFHCHYHRSVLMQHHAVYMCMHMDGCE